MTKKDSKGGGGKGRSREASTKYSLLRTSDNHEALRVMYYAVESKVMLWQDIHCHQTGGNSYDTCKKQLQLQSNLKFANLISRVTSRHTQQHNTSKEPLACRAESLHWSPR